MFKIRCNVCAITINQYLKAPFYKYLTTQKLNV